MMGSDNYDTGQKAVSKFKDDRVRQFYDPNQLAAKSFAGSLGHDDKVAWDIYLFYPINAMWEELPPQPELFVHQLRNSWADQSCLFQKDQLRVKLKEIMNDLFP